MNPDNNMAPPPLSRFQVQLWLVLIVVCVFVTQLVFNVTHQSESHPPEESTIQIDINSADARELSLLPSVGPILASRIIQDREENGCYQSVQDLKRIHGIGEKKLNAIIEICVVNSAVDQDTGHTLAHQISP